MRKVIETPHGYTIIVDDFKYYITKLGQETLGERIAHAVDLAIEHGEHRAKRNMRLALGIPHG